MSSMQKMKVVITTLSVMIILSGCVEGNGSVDPEDVGGLFGHVFHTKAAAMEDANHAYTQKCLKAQTGELKSEGYDQDHAAYLASIFCS